MVETTQFNALPLLSVKSGLDSSLAQISAELEDYFSQGPQALEQLQRAHDELHRTVGVLQMLSLEGLAVFSRELETVLREMVAQKQVPTAMHRDTLRGAMLALAQYLDSLADGASNTALRLFYSYQELHQLRGLESAFEVDLFFPEFGVELPPEVLAVPLLASAAASVKQARAQYQRALLKWLRQDNPADSLQTMRAAVQTVMACTPPDQNRAFWWIATGLLDSLILDGLPAELNANKLLARIDLQMKSMLEHKPRETEHSTTCNMQYMLARSQSVSDTVDKIKQTYELGAYLPEEPPLPYGETAKVLEQMRHLLVEAQGTLEQCEHGNVENATRFAAQLEELRQLSENLDQNTLQFLCKQMVNAVAESVDADVVFKTRLEMAMAMLLLGSGIERYHRLGGQFHEQSRLLSKNLHEAGVVDESTLAELSALHCQMEEQEVLVPLATEMKSNLEQIELGLNAFFGDAGKRAELAPLRKLLSQVNGGLHLLSLDIAAQFIQPVQQAVERYISGTTPAAAEMGAIASATSALDKFVQDLSQGHKPESSGLSALLDKINADLQQAEQTSVTQEAAPVAGVAVREGGEDAELLEVFLEEAQEVLETLHTNLEICQNNPHSRDALIVIRRGFHTLKGSGRMVGLTNLGEVAWAVEKAMNKWLQEDKATSISLLELIGDASVLFQHWIDKLRTGGSALIDATALIAAAQNIESGTEETKAPEKITPPELEPVAEPAAAVVPEVPAGLIVEAAPAAPLPEVQEAESELDDIVIGNVTLSPVLFNIATNEAASIIDTLQQLLASLRAGDAPVISYDFVRAAHTLTGVSRSTGFTDIADLAAALEQWLQDCLDADSAPDTQQMDLLEQTIAALTEMVAALRNRQAPLARPDMIESLQIKKKQLSNTETEASPVIAAEAGLEINEANEAEVALPDDEPDTNLMSYAEYIALNPAQSPQYTESIQLDTQEPEAEAPHSEDMDVVAYVQRVAQAQANEPLKWGTSNAVTEFMMASGAEKTSQNPVEPLLEAQDQNDFHMDFGELQPAEGEPSIAEAGGEEISLNDFRISDETPAEQEAAAVASPAEFTFDFKLPELDAVQPVQEIAEFAVTLPEFHIPEPDEEKQAAQPEPVISSAQNLPEETPPHAAPSEAYGVSASAAPQHTPAAQSEAMRDSSKRKIHDDLDLELLPIFLEEADELYPQLTSELRSWRDNLGNNEEGLKIARKLQRSLHTLKGSARMAGAMRLGELTHRVEDSLDSALAAGKQDAVLLDTLENYFDRIGSALEKLRAGDVAEDEPEAVAEAEASAMQPQITQQQIVQQQDIPKPKMQAGKPEEQAESGDERREAAVLRVRSDIVDDLVNEAGEISVARSRMEIELNAFKGGLHDLNGSVQGLRKLVREIEMHAEGQMQARAAVAGESAEKFDPLEFDRFTRFQELTRFISESVHDVQTVQQTLLKNLDETSAAMSAQAKLNSVLQQSLMSIRMLPFSSISQRLYRIVRQTGKELGKTVNLELSGTEIELDRGVLDKMTAPFEHLLRNAIVHGLESPAQRELKGKPSVGNIALSLRQEGNEVVFEFRDDGAGLNIEKLRNKGIEQGLFSSGEDISDDKAMMLIFETGLSTAAELTEISGRGVGMDVVRSEIKALGGRIDVSSETDKGACFTIYLPLTLAVMKALMVRAGNETYAIPAVMVEQVQQVKTNALDALYQQGYIDWQGRRYPLHYLPSLLGDQERTPESKPHNAILLLRSGDQRLALHLDELAGNREVVVKNVGIQLSHLQGVAGATVQANGRVVLILNPVPLAQMSARVQPATGKAEAKVAQRIPVVMVVDDSLTVRKITSRLLTRVGYEVVTAKDGVDALEKLEEMTPDVMLLDVEMPRMDGFELTKHLRRDDKAGRLPIIMITSRTAEKHRNYALEIGVNEYMGKPYQDDELLESIARYAPLTEAAVGV